MFKNREVKKILFLNLIYFFIIIIIGLILSLYSFNLYKKNLIRNNSILVGNILKNHPELEEEVINELILNSDTYDYGVKILNKYGLDDPKYFDYLKVNNELKQNIILTNILFIIILFMLISITYLIFIKNQYRKINKIDKYMNKILNNDYSLDIRDYVEGDISTLKNDVYKMTIKLKEQTELSIKDKKYLEETLADISHQIKTPLTSMYVINDILSDNDLDKKSQIEFLNKNRNQLERIEWLVTTLLKISRLDSGMVTLKRDNINIDNLINKTIEPIKIMAELKNISIETNIETTNFYLDFNWTLEALTNILKNACEHTNNNGSIKIEVNENPLYLNIKIIDNGVGISESDKKHIFDRFYKGKTNKDSIGIGLNMAKKIINLQNGEIECISKINEGTTFDIKFYKKVI